MHASTTVRPLPQSGPRHSRRRRAVSLLEVLFSIGIIAVGLLGVLAVLPVAASRLAHATITDSADRIGRAAARQFQVEGFQDANSWWLWNAGTPVAGGAYCLDPLFMAKNAATPVANYFPYFAPTPTSWPGPAFANAPVSVEARMVRCSVDQAVPKPNTMPKNPGGKGKGKGKGLVKTTSQSEYAQQLVQAQDDLVFTLDPDATQVPTQNWTDPNNPIKRNYEGTYSWLATLSPDPGSSAGEYVLSAVVFHRRDSDMPLAAQPPSVKYSESERVVDVVQFPGGGYGGGEVRLQLRDNTRPDVDLDVREGQWLMLAGTGVGINGLGQRQIVGRRFEWYRVVGRQSDLVDEVTYQPWGPTSSPPAASAVATADGLRERHVTLSGLDWDPNLITQAVLMNDVVAVNKKTITMVWP